jgi:hypothetical protein
LGLARSVATEKQYLFFKALYDEETSRENHLQQLAKNYLSLITFYSAFILFVVEKLRPDNKINTSIFVFAMLAMLIAFLFSLLSVQISNYEAVCHPEELFDQFGDEATSDEDFFDLRIADYSVACEANSTVNDGKALKLQIAGYSLLAGIAASALYLLVKVVL